MPAPQTFRERFFQGIPRYQWLGTLGRGGMGVVFLAKDLDLDDQVAIKVLQPSFDGNEAELLSRFKREIQLNRKIKHPNVARIHDFGMSGEYPYITMEYIAGKDLKSVIVERRRLHPAEAVAILRQLARGTQAAHELGIIHRDLKPQNVMIEESGAVAILDFGLARGRSNDNLTASSIVLGTPQYIAPEQALGGEADARSDIYSLGIMAYEMLTGAIPFSGETPIATALKQVTDTVPSSFAALPYLPRELKEIVLKALSKRPDDRFSTAAEMESALAMLELGPIPQGPPPIEAPPARPGLGADDVTPRRGISTRLPPQAGGSGHEPAREAAASAGDTPTLVRKRAPTVLVVGPDAGASKALEAAGCRTHQVPDGKAALELVMKDPPDLIVMDVTLPGLDGFDVARIIKSRPELSALPILLTSSRSDRKLFAFALQAGAADFLRKPVEPAFLSWRVWQLLEHQGFVPPTGTPAKQEPLA